MPLHIGAISQEDQVGVAVLPSMRHLEESDPFYYPSSWIYDDIWVNHGALASFARGRSPHLLLRLHHS